MGNLPINILRRELTLKNRKLFAILTLVAFMMTLLPLAAFAANQFASKVTQEDTAVDADGAEYAKFTVYLYDDSNQPVAGTVYIASNRGTTDKIYDDTSTPAPLTPAGLAYPNVYVLNVDAGGTSFNVKSSVAGTAKIGVGLEAPNAAANASIYDYLVGANDATSTSVKLVDVKEITFKTTSVSAVDVTSVVYNGGSTEATVTGGVYKEADVTANGLNYYRAYFVLKDKSGAPVADEDIKFTVNKSGVTFNKTTDTTDTVGKVDVKIYATKSGEYTVKAQSVSDSDVYKEIKVYFSAGDAFDIELKSDDNQLVSKASTNKEFDFKVTDIQGNKIAFTSDAAADAAVDAEVVSEPTGSDITVTVVRDTDNDYAALRVAKFEKEGDYVLRAKLGNGKYQDVKFTVKKQEDVTKLELKYDETNLPYDQNSNVPKIYRVDDYGVKEEVKSPFTGIEFYSSNVDIATMGTGGAAGKVYGVDKDHLGTVTITAIDTVNNLTATATMNIVDKVSAIKLIAPEATAPGETAKVTIQAINKNGDVLALGQSAAVNSTYYVISKPSGAIVSAEEGTDHDVDLKEKGQATIDVESNLPGDVVLQVVVDNMTASVTVPFAEKAPVVTYGAKNVTMFIGSTGFVKDGAAMTMDQAPFIQDNRTFVPVRMVGEALGAEVEYDAATQVITLTRPDMTITMTVGSNVLVKSDGTSVVSDVAPFIVAETGRTVIPFRAIAEAFGATVEAVFAADGTVTAVTFAQ
jgi:hypothetical protein